MFLLYFSIFLLYFSIFLVYFSYISTLLPSSYPPSTLLPSIIRRGARSAIKKIVFYNMLLYFNIILYYFIVFYNIL